MLIVINELENEMKIYFHLNDYNHLIVIQIQVVVIQIQIVVIQIQMVVILIVIQMIFRWMLRLLLFRFTYNMLLL